MIDFESLETPLPSPSHPTPQEALFKKNLSTCKGEIFRGSELQSPAVLASGYSYKREKVLAVYKGDMHE